MKPTCCDTSHLTGAKPPSNLFYTMKQMELSLQHQAANPSSGKASDPSPANSSQGVAKDSDEEPRVYSISEINRAIRETLEGKFSLLWLKGEISNFKAHSSGHFYFSLKDDKAQINAVMFRGHNARLKFRPEDGMEVVVRGKVTVYEPRGNYQIFCELMEPVGAGALQKAFEQLKAKLHKEGLFDIARKRPLPLLPRHIAVVTSPTGAAIRDILNVLRRRHKGLRVTLVPALVQGEQAPASIVAAINLAQKLTDIDVLIVGRGGGSIEDLWAFNNENVARAIAASRVPVISAVGHEVDTTISDFVADLRAPTPSVAAELVVKNALELEERVHMVKRHLVTHMQYVLHLKKTRLESSAQRLIDPQRRLQDLAQRCDEWSERLSGAWQKNFQTWRHKVELLQQKMGHPKERLLRLHEQRQNWNQRLGAVMIRTLDRKKEAWSRQTDILDSLSPLRVVQRGYTILRKNKTVVKSYQTLTVGDQLEAWVSDGRLGLQVTDLEQKQGEQVWTSKKN